MSSKNYHMINSTESLAFTYIGLLLYSYQCAKDQIYQSVESEFYIDFVDQFDVLLAGTLSYLRSNKLPPDMEQRVDKIAKYIVELETYMKNNQLPILVKSYFMQLISIGLWLSSQNPNLNS